MSKKFDDYKNFEIAFPDSSEDYDENYFFQRKYFSDKYEESKSEEKTEILWSRENKYFYETDFFSNGNDSFSDLTGRSTSSCSWHNDEFDMKSGTKVTKSLEAVDNALYEKQLSPFISEEVFQECCNWSNKFPYFRLIGEQVVKCANDSMGQYKGDQKEGISTSCYPFSLHVKGKKISLHTPDKNSKKANFEIIPECEQATFFDEEIDDCGDDKVDNHFVVSQNENVTVNPVHSEQLVANSEATSINFLQDRVIEKLAQHMWPKVLETLQKCHTVQKSDKIDENFQLPPIVAAQMEHKRFIPPQRPKTEGTNLSLTDFPKLSSILSVSPKILQDRKECKSGKSSLRSSRPSSEIHLTNRNNSFSSIQNKNSFQKTSRLLRTSNTSKQVQFTSKKSVKNDDKVTLYLPALEEDIADPIDYLKGVSLQNEPKTISTSVISNFPRNSECFLPPIDTDDHLQSNTKLTRNLFTFFGTDLKCSSKGDIVYKPKTPVSRPNTSASKRGMKQTDTLNYRFINDTFSSISNSNPTEIIKVGDNSEKQVTLFPIVTSLIPSRERNSNSSKKGFLNTFSGRKR